MATVSSADAPTKSIWGIALSCPIFLFIKSTMEGTKTAGLTAAIINPSMAPCTKVNFKNMVAKKAMVNPSNVAGTTLNNIAGRPICFICFKLMPSPPMKSTVTKAISFNVGAIFKVAFGTRLRKEGPIIIPIRIMPIREGNFNFSASFPLKCAKNPIKIKLKISEESVNTIKDCGYKVEYKIYRSTKKNGKYTLKKTTTSKTYTDTKAKKGKTYYYKIKLFVKDSNGKILETNNTNVIKVMYR